MKQRLLSLSVLCLILFVGVTANAIENNQILYEASAKLTETTYTNSSGLHTNAFNTTIASHTFSNGQGIITFNADVTKIGAYAFYQCSKLKSISIPNSVTSIETYAFCACPFTSITIPNSVTTIGDDAFAGCM